jgi:hypothetical protein
VKSNLFFQLFGGSTWDSNLRAAILGLSNQKSLNFQSVRGCPRDLYSLPVTQEVAGSSPVVPANLFNTSMLFKGRSSPFVTRIVTQPYQNPRF